MITAAVPGLFRAFDASVPPLAAYPGCQAVLGYLGPGTDGQYTPHVWTLEEWLRFDRLRQSPIWMYAASLDPAEQGRAAAAAAKGLGWKPFASTRRLIWLDMELAENPAWIAAWAAAVREAGFAAGDYRSLSSVQPAGDPSVVRWIADWDDVPEDEWPNVAGHQYAADISFGGSQVDLNVFAGSVYAAFGHGPRTLVAA